jgi:hypothetical protein
LIGEAIATDTRIDFRLGSVKPKYGGGVTRSTFFSTHNQLEILIDPSQVAMTLAPGHPLYGSLAGTSVALPFSDATALVHELGHAYGNFAGGEPSYFGNTIPHSLKAENAHRALSVKPTYRTNHCGLYPKNNCGK